MIEAHPNWFDRAFFVKDKKARLVIALVSCTIAVATSFYLRYTHALAFHNYFVDVVVRFLICIPLGLVLMFGAMGVYNLVSFVVTRNGSKNE